MEYKLFLNFLKTHYISNSTFTKKDYLKYMKENTIANDIIESLWKKFLNKYHHSSNGYIDYDIQLYCENKKLWHVLECSTDIKPGITKYY
jgi:hypothetical protein